jgi:hypothetical protein
MKRRDVVWIAAIWIVALCVAPTVPAFFADDDPKTNDAAAGFILAAFLGAVATGLYVYFRRHSRNRSGVLVIAALWVGLLGAGIVLAAATGHSYGAGFVVGLGGYGLTVCVQRTQKYRGGSRVAAAQPTRRCPACAEPMPREASVCELCERASAPWTLHEGVWWVRSGSGEWQWFDEDAGFLRSYRGGTPSTSVGGERSL